MWFYLLLFHAVPFVHYSSVKELLKYLLLLKCLLCFAISETVIQYVLMDHVTDYLSIKNIITNGAVVLWGYKCGKNMWLIFQ
jgi:hypothetical protein